MKLLVLIGSFIFFTNGYLIFTKIPTFPEQDDHLLINWNNCPFVPCLVFFQHNHLYNYLSGYSYYIEAVNQLHCTNTILQNKNSQDHSRNSQFTAAGCSAGAIYPAFCAPHFRANPGHSQP